MASPRSVSRRRPLNTRHPLAKGLVGFWLGLPGKSGGGTLYVIGGGRRHGTLAGGATWAAGPNGFGAVVLDGSDDYVDCGTIADVFGAGVTLRAAFRLDAITPGTYQTLISSRNGTGNATPFSLDINNQPLDNGGGRKLRFYVNNGGFSIWQSNGVAPLGEWCTAEVCYAPGSTPLMWINGVPQTVTRTTGASDPAILYTANPLRLGWFQNASGSDASFGGSLAAAAVGNIPVRASWHDQWDRGFPDLLRWLKPWSFGVGTTPITPAGSVTATGALTHAVSKALAGSETPTGALAKLAAKPLAGSSAGAGSLIKLAGKPLAGSATPAGALTHAAAKSLAGSSAPSGAAAKAVTKPLAGSTTGTGVAAKAVSKPLAGSSTGAGALGTVTVKLLDAAGSCTATGAEANAVAKAVGGSSTATGATAKAVAKPLAGSAQPAGAVAKQAAKSLAGSSTPTGTLGTVRAALLAVGGAVTGAGVLVRAAWKVLAGLVTGAGALTTSGGAVAVAAGSRGRASVGPLVGGRASVGPLVGGAARTEPGGDL